MAFQIIDDCKDIISEEKTLGKHPGQDVAAGDITLPFLNLLDVVGPSERDEIKRISESGLDKHRLKKIKQMFIETGALGSTQKTALYYIDQAKHELNKLEDSDYKKSLNYLTDYIAQKPF